MEDEQAKPPLPAIPVLVFAAIDLVLAFLLLIDGGFTLHFWAVALIGVGLAGVGLWTVLRRSA